MTTLHDAARQALEALEIMYDEEPMEFTATISNAIDSLRSALTQEPAIRMHFKWVGGQWLFNDNPIDNGEWNITLKDGGWVIYPKMEHAAPKVTMLVDPRDPQRAYMAQVETQNYREAWTMQTSPSPEAEPVQEPQRKPLTRKEIMDLCASKWASHPVEVARLIERAHGIGGQE